MTMMVFEAYAELLWLELRLRGRGFAAVHQAVTKLAVSRCDPATHSHSDICRAVDLACVFYFKEVLCLQRSAAAVRLLRRHGVAAELVTGVQQWPFRAHAWVEIAGQVVNDKPHVTGGFAVIDRC